MSQRVLTEDQKRRIVCVYVEPNFQTNHKEENRRKALERLNLRRNANPPRSTQSASTGLSATGESRTNQNRTGVQNTKNASVSQDLAPSIPQLPRVELTPEQRARIQKNREEALRRSERTRRDASHIDSTAAPVSEADRKRFKMDQNRPSIQRKDYIEYDFSTMKDSRGGFLEDKDKFGLQGHEEEPQSLQDWKEKQKQEHLVKDLPPPVDLEHAPRCFECNSLEVDPNMYTNFKVRVCRRCIKENQDKYSLLTKTECREDYLLTEPELKDTSILHRIEKPNPHGFLRMQLFLRFQVEGFAWKKWGSAEGLDKEWERRERVRLERKDKKYREKLKEMRKKTRAEEYTRKLRDGKSLGERHVHLWSAPLSIGERMVKRRCTDCGIETEEVII